MNMKLLEGKKGIILGVANKRSIAWAIAQAAAGGGARIALTYQGPRLEENVRKLAATLEGSLVLPCDVAEDQQVEECFRRLGEEREEERSPHPGRAREARLLGPLTDPLPKLVVDHHHPARLLLRHLSGSSSRWRT